MSVATRAHSVGKIRPAARLAATMPGSRARMLVVVARVQQRQEGGLGPKTRVERADRSAGLTYDLVDLDLLKRLHLQKPFVAAAKRSSVSRLLACRGGCTPAVHAGGNGTLSWGISEHGSDMPSCQDRVLKAVSARVDASATAAVPATRAGTPPAGGAEAHTRERSDVPRRTQPWRRRRASCDPLRTC
jgi:hypothetical protein